MSLAALSGSSEADLPSGPESRYPEEWHSLPGDPSLGDPLPGETPHVRRFSLPGLKSS